MQTILFTKPLRKYINLLGRQNCAHKLLVMAQYCYIRVNTKSWIQHIIWAKGPILETLAIVQALKEFWPYRLGILFKLVTDCSAFSQTMKKKDLFSRNMECFAKRLQLNYCVFRYSHDALSRNTVMTITTEFLERLKMTPMETNI